MAGQNRTSAHALELLGRLEKEPYRFSFYQALRRLENAYRHLPRWGEALRPGDEPLRLSQDPSMAFAPSTVRRLVSGKDGLPPRLQVTFLGLFGPNGPLPLHLTEYARDRMRNSGDHTFARFLDIFHHRMLTLFYRAWASAQPTVHFDRPESDRFAVYIGALLGIGQATCRNRDEMPDLAKLYFAGHMSCPTRHADGLASILQDFFQLPIQLVEFVGHWIRLPEESRSRLGRWQGENALGKTAIIGERVWNCQQRFRIDVGPIGLKDYLRLLPGGDSLRRLSAIVQNYVGFELSWELKLTLKKQEVPKTSLGRMGNLGWTTWLAAKPMQDDADDLLLNPQRVSRSRQVHQVN